MTKTCRGCQLLQPLAAFYPLRRGARTYWSSYCRACSAEEKRLRNYGLSAPEYEMLMAAQEGVCAVCRAECPTGRRLAVDHDHRTGAPRGLLCFRCNTALGLLDDSRTLLLAAAAYLQENE